MSDKGRKGVSFFDQTQEIGDSNNADDKSLERSNSSGIRRLSTSGLVGSPFGYQGLVLAEQDMRQKRSSIRRVETDASLASKYRMAQQISQQQQQQQQEKQLQQYSSQQPSTQQLQQQQQQQRFGILEHLAATGRAAVSRRWAHIFPHRTMVFREKDDEPNWKSLCEPAILPLTQVSCERQY